ncbi:hypothetical protein FF125_00940 [Aureibaculum algae]|uniref:Uncharacterized protein n=1 Tax=Aureibaculum algae TaxID=2584122 RepID=A0A5B7TNY3_9FLAO|nr:hypothetical protein [Aureibaculum algae]QCX37071.1 hypothetical protein FF125_00940 [Aureibaculum algae]
MKKSKPKLWKRILFGLIAFIFTMAVFIGGVFLKANYLKNEAAQLTEKDFITEEVVIDSAYTKLIYQMPWPLYLRKVVFAEITFSLKNKPIYFRSPQFVRNSNSFSESRMRNLNLKHGDTVSIIYKKTALEAAKSPNFLSKFYHRYKTPLVYNMSNDNGKLFDVGLDYDEYIDEKIHNESFYYLIILFTIISIAFVGFKFNLIK